MFKYHGINDSFLSALISLKPDGLPLWQYFFYVETGFGWVFGTAGLTGVLLSIIFVIMVLFALSCVRRKGYFEVWTLVGVILLIYDDIV
jgi:hypothetical protein